MAEAKACHPVAAEIQGWTPRDSRLGTQCIKWAHSSLFRETLCQAFLPGTSVLPLSCCDPKATARMWKPLITRGGEERETKTKKYSFSNSGPSKEPEREVSSVKGAWSPLSSNEGIHWRELISARPWAPHGPPPGQDTGGQKCSRFAETVRLRASLGLQTTPCWGSAI